MHLFLNNKNPHSIMKLWFYGIAFCIVLTNISFAQTFSSLAALNDSTTKVYVEKLEQLAINYYPQNEYFRGKVGSSEESVSQSKWSWLNTINLSSQINSKTTQDPATASILPTFGIGVTVNIGSIVLIPSKVAQAQQELRAAKASLEAQLAFVRAEVRRRFAKYTQSLDLLKIRVRAVNDSESEVEYIRHKFEKGETTIDEYNKVLRSYTDNLQGKVVSEGDVLYTKVTLEEMIGIKLEDVK